MMLPSTIILCWRTSWATVGTVHTAAHGHLRHFIHVGLGSRVPRRVASAVSHTVLWAAHGAWVSCVLVGGGVALGVPAWVPPWHGAGLIGTGGPAAHAVSVPEPSSALVFGVAVLALLLIRRTTVAR